MNLKRQMTLKRLLKNLLKRILQNTRKLYLMVTGIQMTGLQKLKDVDCQMLNQWLKQYLTL